MVPLRVLMTKDVGAGPPREVLMKKLVVLIGVSVFAFALSGCYDNRPIHVFDIGKLNHYSENKNARVRTPGGNYRTVKLDDDICLTLTSGKRMIFKPPYHFEKTPDNLWVVVESKNHPSMKISLWSIKSVESRHNMRNDLLTVALLAPFYVIFFPVIIWAKAATYPN